MSKKHWNRNQGDFASGGPISSTPAPEPDPKETLVPLAQDGAIAIKPTPPAPPVPDKDGIAPGQIDEGVVVPDRPINRLGLRPGAVLPPIQTEVPYGDGRWMCSFVGERMSKIDADAEMLKTGKRRA